MADYIVITRNKNGSLEERAYMAVDRADLFKKLAADGVSAVRVCEGVVSKKPRKVTGGVVSKGVLGVVAAVVVAALVGVVWMMMQEREEITDEKESRRKIPFKEKESLARRDEKEKVPVITNKTTNVAIKVDIPVANVITARTASTGRVMTLMDGTVVTNIVKRPFKRDLEHALWVTLRPGNMGGSLLTVLQHRHTEDELIKMLKDVTVIEPTDSPGLKRIKGDVQALKERMLEEIGKGRTVADMFDEFRSQANKENMVKVETMKLRAEAIRSGNPELVRKVVEKGNQYRREVGLSDLEVPEKFKEEDIDGKQNPQGSYQEF